MDAIFPEIAILFFSVMEYIFICRLCNSFLEIQLTCHTFYPLKYNLMIFSVFTELCSHQFFICYSRDILYTDKQILIFRYIEILFHKWIVYYTQMEIYGIYCLAPCFLNMSYKFIFSGFFFGCIDSVITYVTILLQIVVSLLLQAMFNLVQNVIFICDSIKFLYKIF